MAGTPIYGEMWRAQLEQLSADPAQGTQSRIWWNTTATQVKVDNGTAIRAFLVNDQKMVMGNNATAGNNVRWNRAANATLELLIGSDTTAEGSSTPANWAKLNSKVGGSLVDTYLDFTESASVSTPAASTLRMYANTDGSLHVVDPSGIDKKIGSGAGGINYLSGPSTDFEGGVGSWVAYSNTAQLTPVTGTGGSPTVTITSSSSSPLRGTASGLITKDAANRQGQGASVVFTIDSADQSKPLSVSFDYISTSAFAASSGASGSESDIEVWVYDVTNAILIPVSPYKITANNAIFGKFQGVFQSNSNSTSYRLILHIGTVNASAWTFKFDNVVIGPQLLSYGAPMTDDIAYVPTFSAGFGTVTGISAFYRRVGNCIEIFGTASTGTTAASAGTISLPSGLTPLASEISGSGNIFGSITVAAVSGTKTSNVAALAVLSGSSVLTLVNYCDGAATDNLVGTNISSVIGGSTPFSWYAKVPITGYSATVQMSQDSDTRVVACRVYTTANASFASSSTTQQVTNFAATKDTHGAFASNVYTIPVSGFYKITFGARYTFNAEGSLAIAEIQKNSVAVARGFVNSTIWGGGGTNDATAIANYEDSFLAGDTIKFYSTQQNASAAARNIIGDANGLSSYAEINRLSGPATIAATETVAARGTNTAGTSIVSATDTLLTMVIDFDSHGSLSTSGLFTAPISGKYALKGCVTFVDAIGTGNLIALKFKKNGSTQLNEIRLAAFSASSNYYACSGADTVRLLAGDTVGMYAWQNTGAGRVLSALAGQNYFAVERIGSY